MHQALANERISFCDVSPPQGHENDVRAIFGGLTGNPRRISSRFFYDAAGSKLFERITHLPEYYLTRIESGLIAEFATSARACLQDLDIVEIGSGDCRKISILLDALDAASLPTLRYVPFDACAAALRDSAQTLAARYQDLSIHCMVGDFNGHLDLLDGLRRKLFCFFGSTIGNLSFQQRASFLDRIGRQMHPGDRLLVGVDLVKPKEIIERAYNDSAAVTAAFNRNILKVVNSITGTDFDPACFEHVAFYDERRSRVEMHLRAGREMTVASDRFPFRIRIGQGEMIHTENSHKFSIGQIQAQVETARLHLDEIRMDEQEWFGLLGISKRLK